MKFFTEYKAAKAYYFSILGASGPILPFIPVIAKNIGYSSITTGTVMTMTTLLSIVTKPIFGSFADKFLLHKAILLLALVVDSIGSFSVQYFPPAEVDRSVIFECSSSPRIIVRRSHATNAIGGLSAESDQSFTCQLDLSAQLLRQTNLLPESLSGEPYLSMQVSAKYYSVHPSDTLVMDVDQSVNGSVQSLIATCIQPINITGKLYCENAVLDTIVAEPVPEEVASLNPLFWIFAIDIIVGATANNVALSVGDSICLKQLGDEMPKIADIKIFGSVAWGIFGLFGGTIADWYSQGKRATDYTLNCYICGLLHIMAIISAYYMKCDFNEKPIKICADVKSVVFRDVHFIIFLIVAVMSGLCMGLATNFLIWYIEDVAAETGSFSSIKTLEGVVIFVQTVGGEIPFLLLSGYFIRWLGHVYCFSLIFLAHGIRFSLYYILSNPWWIIPIELLNGITNTLCKVVFATYAFELAVPGTETTILGISSAAFEGIGYSAGAFIGGIMIDALGMRLCYLSFGICALAAAFLNTLLQYCLSKGSNTKAIQH